MMTTPGITRLAAFRAVVMLLSLAGCQQQSAKTLPAAELAVKPQWLAGDHHVHTHYSVKWDNSVFPPKPILGGDAKYSIAHNARMAASFGLRWMVVTDHGGPNRARLALEQAYPELLASRAALPQILQFYGMEFDVPGNSPGGRHASLIMPKTPTEAQQLFQIESRFNGRQGVPPGPEKAEDSFMLKALQAMAALPDTPLLLVNHPARLAKGLRQYFKVTPKQLRDWQDTAPGVVIGMSGAEGHQAATLNPDGSSKAGGIRGEYPDHPTYGGYDQMTARLGGVWDSLLAEGRRWWVTGVSDSHGHYSDGWADFWPGQYAKTYVLAQQDYASIFAALKAGKIFVTTGDLISALDLTVAVKGAAQGVGAGETLKVKATDELVLRLSFRDPDAPNGGGFNPQVARIDLIRGLITSTAANGQAGDQSRAVDRNNDEAPATKVSQRWYAGDWQIQSDGSATLEWPLGRISQSQYLRLRGTNQRDELEPAPDQLGENPWHDLWFYSNPVYLQLSAD